MNASRQVERLLIVPKNVGGQSKWSLIGQRDGFVLVFKTVDGRDGPKDLFGRLLWG